jgi:hypothetical protein
MSNNLFVETLILQQKIKFVRAMKGEIVILRKFKPSEKTKKQLNLPDDFMYVVVYDPKTKKISCDCLGFITHKHCRHSDYFKSFIQELEKQNEKEKSRMDRGKEKRNQISHRTLLQNSET